MNPALFVLELLAVTLLFFNKLEKRKLWWLRLIICFAFVCGASYLYSWTRHMILAPIETNDFNIPSPIDTEDFNLLSFGMTYILTMLMQLIFFTLYVCIVFLTFKTSFINILSIGCVSFSVRNIAYGLFSIYLGVCGSKFFINIGPLSIAFDDIIYIIFYVAVYVACYFIFIRKYDSEDEAYLNKKLLPVLLGMIFINIFLNSVMVPKDIIQTVILDGFVLVARILLSILGLFLQFYVVKSVKLQVQYNQFQYIMQQQSKQYEVAKESIDTVNINAHDLKHQISVILQAIHESNRPSAIEDELNEMVKTVSVVDTVYHTGNRALDVTLTEKTRICASKNIKISTIADGSAIGYMTDVDVYTLFGNALDNAIEATENIPEPDERIISFSLHKECGTVFFHLENTFLEAPKFVKGIPQTSKSDKNFHGYGVKSIMHIVSKYSGNIKIGKSKGLFYLDVILPDKAAD